MDLTDAQLFRRWSRGPYEQHDLPILTDQLPTAGATVMVEKCPLCWRDIKTITHWPPGGPKRKQKARDVSMLEHLMEEH